MLEEGYELFGVEKPRLSDRKFSLRRSHLEIRMDILASVKLGFEKPTQIMYKANLSWTALKDHLAALERSKLLVTSQHGSRTRYELTERGSVLLGAYRKLFEEVNALGTVAKASATF